MSGYGYVEQYRDDAGEFRWRAIAGNGETIADSAEGYTTPTACDEGLEALVRLLTGGERSLAPDVRWSQDERTQGHPPRQPGA